jgi:capsule polysaccharide export protein KpsE/RkpR
MSGTGVKQRPEPDPQVLDPELLEQRELGFARERQAELLRYLWERRTTLFHAAVAGLILSTLIAFLIPTSYTSTAQLMPPETQSSSGLAMMAALAGKAGGSLAGLGSDLLGLKSTGALFIGVLRSETAQDRVVQQFNLQKIYGMRLLVDARKKLDEHTGISEDRKSGIITISVTDHSPQRSAAIANAYVDELNSLVAELSTSAAHRERVFLQDRLKVAQQDLNQATEQLAQFSSKNSTLDMQTEGKAMLDAASTLTGELIVAQSQLEGLRQIYTDDNARVRALKGRVAELRKQLEKLGGVQVKGSSVDPAIVQSASPQIDSNGSIPFPTIRNLPLLGAKYADYYRNAKIQETVFELLTEQFELAKVQEAKDTPSVKVLDPGRVPERKSYPPRLLIMMIGTFLACAAVALWLLATKGWTEIDPADPRKVLALEVAATFQANAPWASQNGDAPHSWPQKIWSRLRSLRPPSDGPSTS